MNIYARAAEADAVVLLRHSQMTPSMHDFNGVKKNTGMKHILMAGCQDPKWIPIHTKHRMLPLEETELAESQWRNKLMSTIKYRYQAAEYYDDVIDNVEYLLNSSKHLGIMSYNTFKWGHANLHLGSRIYNDFDVSKRAGQKGEWILDICKQLGATEYITGLPGLSYLDLNKFKQNNIKLKIQDWRPIQYKQHKNTWNPNMSILDSVFYNGFKVTRNLLINGIN